MQIKIIPLCKWEHATATGHNGMKLFMKCGSFLVKISLASIRLVNILLKFRHRNEMTSSETILPHCSTHAGQSFRVFKIYAELHFYSLSI